MNYLIFDINHLWNRAKFVVKGHTPEEKIGMTLTILFSSIGKTWRTQKANHLVLAFDGRSWRKDIYKPYKANRTEARSTQSPKEQEDNKVFYEAFEIFKQFVTDHTNCSILYDSKLEADDLISGFISSHPLDHHTIISSDKDFEQLLSDNVVLYDGVQDITTTNIGIYDYKNKQIIDKKTKLPKLPIDPEWAKFEKAVRGCVTDNVFSAYPGARIKGSKNKIGLLDAFEDRHKKGFNWNAFMMTRWTDHNDVEHKVLDDYNRNLELVDLNGQPDHIKKLIQENINKLSKRSEKQIGVHLLKFCGRYELNKIADQSRLFSEILSAPYEDK